MSFILDALRKADSERRLGHLPPLDGRSLGPGPDAAPEAAPAAPGHTAGRWRWLAAGVGLGAAVLAVAGWWAGSWQALPRVPSSSPVAVPSTTASAMAPAAQSPTAAPMPPPAAVGPAGTIAAASSTAASAAAALASAPAPSPQVPTSPPSAEARDASVAPSAPPRPRQAAAPPPAQVPAEARSTPRPPSGRSETAGSPRGTATPARPATPTARPMPTRDELPADLRRGLPPLAVGGAVFSNDPASRLLILDGQLVREGDRVGPDLVLERIRARSAVLNLRGERFSIAW